MTIDEFMRDIAPKMRPGWVAMDESENWFQYKKKMKKCCEILEKHPRFKKCEEIKCPYRYDCQEKLEVRAARDIGAWGLDYYCQKINKIVYRD